MAAPRSARRPTSTTARTTQSIRKPICRSYTTGEKPGTQSYRVVDANTVKLTPKDNTGKITFDGIRTRSVSRDGKTLTDVQKGTNAQGVTVDIVQIFERLELQAIRTKASR
jgi:hypothetical protein